MMIYNSAIENIMFVNLDSIFKQTNKMVGEYLLNQGLPITFDFSDKNNKAIYTHYFLNNVCESLRTYTGKQKLIFYNNTLSKDVFRNKLIAKVRRIFGFKIFDGVWDIVPFLQMVRERDIQIIDNLELLIKCDCKPKTFRHIKKYLEKEGLKALNDTYFKDISNKMLILC